MLLYWVTNFDRSAPTDENLFQNPLLSYNGVSSLKHPSSCWLLVGLSPIPSKAFTIIWSPSLVSMIHIAFRIHYFAQRGVPSIIGSYGASAVLIYAAIESPLAQPRTLVGGHLIGTLIGICITKLFRLLSPEHCVDFQWLAASLSVSLAIVAMQSTKTVHPPAGVTALLATVDQQVIDLSWYLLPVVLLSSTLALVVALLVNNLQRRYPVFWFTDDLPPVMPSEPLGRHRDRTPEK